MGNKSISKCMILKQKCLFTLLVIKYMQFLHAVHLNEHEEQNNSH